MLPRSSWNDTKRTFKLPQRQDKVTSASEKTQSVWDLGAERQDFLSLTSGQKYICECVCICERLQLMRNWEIKPFYNCLREAGLNILKQLVWPQSCFLRLSWKYPTLLVGSLDQSKTWVDEAPSHTAALLTLASSVRTASWYSHVPLIWVWPHQGQGPCGGGKGSGSQNNNSVIFSKTHFYSGCALGNKGTEFPLGVVVLFIIL